MSSGVAASPGYLLVFEGIDGVGKSTQIRLLAQSLRERGHQVVTSREPTEGPYGRRLRDSAQSGRLSAEQELDLFLRDRRQHVEELIQPALEAGKVILLDRYYFSSMAYQSQRGFDVAWIRELNEEFAPRPDLLIHLTLPVEEALERIGGRGDKANEFEQSEGLEACKAVFDSLEDDFVRRVDCRQAVGEVAAEVEAVVMEKLKEGQA